MNNETRNEQYRQAQAGKGPMALPTYKNDPNRLAPKMTRHGFLVYPVAGPKGTTVWVSIPE